MRFYRESCGIESDFAVDMDGDSGALRERLAFAKRKEQGGWFAAAGGASARAIMAATILVRNAGLLERERVAGRKRVLSRRLVDHRNDGLLADAGPDEFPDSGVVKQRLTIGCERRDGRQSGDFACGHRNPFGLRRARAGPSVILSRMRIGGKVNDR